MIASHPLPTHVPVAPAPQSLTTDCRHVAQLLLSAAEHAPDAGLVFPGDSIDEAVLCSYPSLLAEARRVCGGLRARGLPAGHKIAIAIDGARDFLPVFWGAVLGGYVPCPLPPLRGTEAQKLAALRHVARLLEGPTLVTLEKARHELPEIEHLAVATVEALRASPLDAMVFEPRGGDVALLVLTSGSTGNAKAVKLSHDNLLASMRAKAERQALGPDDVTMNWISFDHVAALLECHLLPVSLGARQVHADPQRMLADPLQFLDLLDRHRVTMTFTPNFLLGELSKRLAQVGPSRRWELSRLKIIVSGGEANVTRTGEAFLELLAPSGLGRGVLSPAFGMTETCAGSVYSREFPDADVGCEFASLGPPVRGLELRVVDDDERPLPEGDVGELHARGPMVFRGYLNDEAATAQAFTEDGWFRTGDRGKLVGGRLTLVGRSKDSIIVNGANYYSHDLEAALEELDCVTRSYVAAFPIRPANSDTEQLAILFTPTVDLEDEPAVHRAVMNVRDRAVLHWGLRPALVLPVPRSELPKTSLGKLTRPKLRKRLESGELAARESWIAEVTRSQMGGLVAPSGELEDRLVRIYAEIFERAPEAVSVTANFFDLGGTSLDILRLRSKVAETLGIVDLPVIALLKHPTARDLARLLGSGERGAAAEYDPIVTLQHGGAERPLLCVHPGVGEVLVFVNLAKYFSGERPIHALRARGFNEGETFFARFDEMVDCYVKAVRALQPEGPYSLCGYSYGGAVAFEMAKVLEAQGQVVDFVGIFNLPPHIKYRMDQLDYTEAMLNLALFLSLVDKEQIPALAPELRPLPVQEQLEHVMRIAPPRRLVELDLDLRKFGAWAELTQSLLRMGRTYQPGGSVRGLTVFYATPLAGTKQDWLEKQLKEWDRFTREPTRFVEVSGEHYTLMGPKHVATFQSILRKELARAERRAG